MKTDLYVTVSSDRERLRLLDLLAEDKRRRADAAARGDFRVHTD